ncbi:hypothetical protein EVA_05818 [gut metagenome]|uniref:Uncharacterized protein n=1 Tax=gut metagenome TaxID=749906 RepID=J9GTN4_9ZZZZ
MGKGGRRRRRRRRRSGSRLFFEPVELNPVERWFGCANKTQNL